MAKKEGLDTLIVFDIDTVGLVSKYNEKGDVEQTFAYFDVYGLTGKMKRGKIRFGLPGKILWYEPVPDSQKMISLIEGDWNEAPNFPKVKTAMDEAMEGARKYLAEKFFKNAPPLGK